MKSFVDAFGKFLDYAADVEKQLTITLEEEVVGLGNSSSIGPKTKSLCLALPKWREALKRVHSRLSALVNVAGGEGERNSDSTKRDEIFADMLEATNQVCCVMCNCVHARDKIRKPLFVQRRPLNNDDIINNFDPQLSHHTKEISKMLSAKMTLEHQLPNTTSDLRSTNDCIVSSLIALVTCISKVRFRLF